MRKSARCTGRGWKNGEESDRAERKNRREAWEGRRKKVKGKKETRVEKSARERGDGVKGRGKKCWNDTKGPKRILEGTRKKVKWKKGEGSDEKCQRGGEGLKEGKVLGERGVERKKRDGSPEEERRKPTAG